METETETKLMPKKNMIYDLIDYVVNTCPGLIVTSAFLYALTIIREYVLPDGIYLLCVLVCGGIAMVGVVLSLQSHNMWYINRRIKELDQKR